jgi:peptidoglycan-associated lipoprotein
MLPALAAVSTVLFAQDAPRAELGLAYNYLRTNAPPDGCGCFSMNGGSVSFAWRLRPRISLVADIGATRVGDVTSEHHDLTLTTLLFGSRFHFPEKRMGTEQARYALKPFAQVLFGGAHASGALSGTASGSSNGFAFAAGGGVDMSLNRRIALRLLQTDYLLTRVPNGVNDNQNSLRVASGVVIRLK